MIIDGKKIQQEILDEIGLQLQGKSVVFLQFGENKISLKYVQAKMRIAKKLGVVAKHVVSEIATTKGAGALVASLSSTADGIVVQLPLPEYLDTVEILSQIPPAKDIDVLNKNGAQNKAPTTHKLQPVSGAVGAILARFAPDLHDKKIVILGKGLLVGLPTANLLSLLDIRYTIFDKQSDQDLMKLALLEADVVICGTGLPHFLKPTMIKPGAVLIDAGTSEQGGVLLGDVDPECYTKASAYTPVPGGVGPIALAILFRNMLA